MKPLSKNLPPTDKTRVFASISARAKKLLALEEGSDVEFKKSLAGLDAEDLVAFANSKNGGVIFIGVDEEKLSHGRRRGLVVGCSVGDRERLGVVSRAHGCLPPIEVEIFTENSKSSRPFFRIEIPPGPEKPYCTPGGTYKVRGDGRNLPMIPSQLLSMFLESQSRNFVERFQQATGSLAQQLDHLIKRTYDLEYSLESVEGSVSDAEAQSEDAASEAQALAEGIDDIEESVRRLHEKLDAILEKFQIENPDDARVRAWMARMDAAFAQLETQEKKKRSRKT